MSIVFVPRRLRGKAKIDQETIQRLLDENDQLIRCVAEYMQKGRAVECVQYQQILHRNIVYLATIADISPNTDSSTSGEVKYHTHVTRLSRPRPHRFLCSAC
ncbi:SS18-like protein 2 isoform 1-T1 [Synchiropus picturatus]